MLDRTCLVFQMEGNLTIGLEFLRLMRRLEEMPKRERASLMRHLYDGYASANFGYDGYDHGRMLTLDEAELFKWLAGRITESMGLCDFDHYSLEEIYCHPVGKSESHTDRMDKLKDRANHQYHKGGIIMPASAALRVSREVVQFYEAVSPRTKLLAWWKVVSHELEVESAKELK